MTMIWRQDRDRDRDTDTSMGRRERERERERGSPKKSLAQENSTKNEAPNFLLYVLNVVKDELLSKINENEIQIFQNSHSPKVLTFFWHRVQDEIPIKHDSV